MAASVNRLAGALCFNNGDNAEERLREFLAVSKLILQVTLQSLSFTCWRYLKAKLNH